jgi:outer membrane protein insertion porin family
LLFGVGFSDSDGIVFNGSITESNLFGTGKELSISLDTSRANTLVQVRYVNPFWRKSGVSRGFRFVFTDVDTETLDIGAYQTNTRSAGMFFGIPISEIRMLNVGFDIDRTEITAGSDSAQVAKDFVDANGPANTVLRATLGWTQDSLNRAIFPTKGGLQRVSGEITVPGSDLEYYKLNYTGARYFPLGGSKTVRVKGEIGIGDLPFYQNFFAGGSRSVRGYKSRTLGPRDTAPPFDPIGGDQRVLLNAEYIFPLPGAKPGNQSQRLSFFLDGGQVFGPGLDSPGETIDFGELRYSIGLAFNWFSPVGPLAISVAAPLNDQPGDDTEPVQFTLGVPLR